MDIKNSRRICNKIQANLLQNSGDCRLKTNFLLNLCRFFLKISHKNIPKIFIFSQNSSKFKKKPRNPRIICNLLPVNTLILPLFRSSPPIKRYHFLFYLLTLEKSHSACYLPGTNPILFAVSLPLPPSPMTYYIVQLFQQHFDKCSYLCCGFFSILVF